MYSEFLQWLEDNKDEKYREFNSKIVNSPKKQYGVRVPLLRKKAKEIAKTDALGFLASADPKGSLEECMVYGLVVAYSKLPLIERIEKTERFIYSADSWAEIDIAVSSFKHIEKNKDKFIDKIKEYINSDKEFVARSGYIMLLDFYVEKEYLSFVFDMLNYNSADLYYVKMAKAWLFSVCFVKFREESFEFLKVWDTDKWTYNKAIQKTLESYRVSLEDKKILKTLKK